MDLARQSHERIVRESPTDWAFARLDELWLPPEVLQRSP
jgi:hypothetical protein